YRTYGILMIKSSNNTLVENDVSVTSLVNQSLAVNSTNSLVGIDFYYDCDNNIISKNKINVTGLDNCLYGAGALAHPTGEYAATTAINNTFISNDIYISGPNVGEGLILGQDCDDTKITDNNVVLNCGRTVYGIVLEMSHDSTITGNNIVFDSEVGYGIEGFVSDDNVIENNIITGDGKIISGIAAIKSSNYVIQNNTITSNGDGSSLDFVVRDSLKAPNSGIYFEGVSKGNLIDSNIITTENGYPVDLSVAATGNNVTYNYLKGKEGSGDDGVNNSKGNIVHDNYESTFDNIVMDNVTAEYNSKFTVTVKTKNAANGANAQFRLGDLIIGNATVNNGQASLTYTLNKNYNVGNYTITAVLSKPNVKSEEITANLEIIKANVNIDVEDVSANAGDTVPFTAVVMDSNGQPIADVEVKFQRNANFIGSANTDKDGKAVLNRQIPASLAEGTYTIFATVTESDNYNQAIGNATLTVMDASKTSTKITANDITMYVKDGTRLVGTITDSNGKPLSNITVAVTINGVTRDRISDANGQVSSALNLDAGTYDASFVFKGDSKYRASSANSTVTIKPTLAGNDIVMMYKDGTKYLVAVMKDNKPVANVNIDLNINGVIYHRTTNAVGTAALALNLNPGNYTITAMRTDTDERLANNIEIKPLLAENKDIEMYFKNGTGYTVKVIKQDGNVAGAGETVTFNINGVMYERKTDDQGIAKLNLNLNPGDYIITAMYNGCMVSNNIKILPVLYAQDLTKKYGEKTPFTVNVVDGHGKPLANTNVSFNINGVFYIRTSGDDGIVKLNINLMVGKYIITSSYNGSSIANTVTVTS
ncbi:Ig-like domain-containing protein, partial [Methanobrevibacter sp.]|uniref:Ig-like domain-containing protein n=1 Tax=Methanobrevibacter sp. TaxID=66852 RepID=UPI00388DAFDF